MSAATRRCRSACLALVFAAGLPAMLPLPAAAAPTPEFTLHIRHQAFDPETLTIPAGQTVKIIVRNDDAMPAEFESSDFNREKVVPGGTAVPVFVGPLAPGSYKFFNDFHPASTGRLIVAPAPNHGK